jgi:hypothetical protein
MAISTDWNIDYINKQINHAQWQDEITGSSSSVKEVTSVTTVADVADSLDGAYFILYSATDATKYHVWYNTSGGSATDPAPADSTAIEVAITTGDTATAVATATRSAIDALADFVGTGATDEVIITNADFGSSTDASDFDTGFTIAVTTPGVGETVYSVNALYSYLQDTFDEVGQMDDKVPMSAQTPTEYSLINNWFIDEVSIKYLYGGAIKTIGWTSGEIVQQDLPNSYTPVVASDLGKVVTEADTGDTGALLFADNTRQRWWIRPDVPGTGGDEFDDAGSAYTIGSGTGAGTSTAPATSGENIWANMYTIGTIEDNTAIYVVQDSTKVSAWWPVGHIDVLLRVQEAGSTTGANGGDIRDIFIAAREYSKLYDHFVSSDITGGRNPVPLATAADLNNTTGTYSITLSSSSGTFTEGDTFTKDGDITREGTITTVEGTNPTTTLEYYLSGTSLVQFSSTDDITTSAGATGTVNGAPTNQPTVPEAHNLVSYYGNDITLTFGDTSEDLNNGNGAQDYDVSINCGGLTVAEMYEWLKFITTRGSTSTPQLKTGTGTEADTNIDGEQYISLLSSFTPVKASPFGTFAGGKFFGAQGVWIENFDPADAQNFQLIDADGDTQVPPNTVSVTVSSVVTSDVVGVFVLTGASGTVNKTTYDVDTGTADANTLTVSGLIDTRTPQSGVLRIVDDSDSLKAEQQYEYLSWSTAADGVFTLNSSSGQGLGTLTVTGASSTTVLIDSAATFQTWRVRPGDTIDNTTDVESATVVSVDSETQLTTTTLSGGASYNSGDEYTFTTELDRLYEAANDTVYVPIINEKIVSGTEVSNTLIYTAPTIPVLVRVRQGKVILPFEIENTITNSGMSQAAIRTADTIAT